ncbi:ABC-2 type transport system ATP-binding protein [Marinitoga hydrogenitolerans DSM 16785]|uniref:ABC-2 type transport system ATP-binding protein n=1 Tax=Marinitoga hydrogenitolerans (strain DSM 16785 / JCM 12826 / AT1271) TaxID=1122195 RepID=A0A1M5AM48_MARH1|nr:ABC transporter ATP-binding protein [Marinitoga hydrogenitolerans]SHF31245.1 ABC-2 type transport system ATP-binding protein [Marinitoga hydrogenitolerans DSM 16785]
MKVIEAKNIKKSFENLEVLKEINLSIKKGDFAVVIGKNGSGKSTLLKIAIGLLLPDEGEIKVLNYDVKTKWKKLSKEIGVVLTNERSLYWKLTAYENLDIFGGIYGVKRNIKKEKIRYLLEKFNLTQFSNITVENFSTGMRKKLMLCKALIHEPKVLFLDEILNGLDPEAVYEMIEYLNELNKEGLTIFMISHILHGFSKNTDIYFLKDGSLKLTTKFGDIKEENKNIYDYFRDIIKSEESV